MTLVAAWLTEVVGAVPCARVHLTSVDRDRAPLGRTTMPHAPPLQSDVGIRVAMKGRRALLVSLHNDAAVEIGADASLPSNTTWESKGSVSILAWAVFSSTTVCCVVWQRLPG